MSKKKYDALYAQHSHGTESATIKVPKFTIDGKPVCMSWYGGGSHNPACCHFLLLTRMGTKDFCGFLGKEIHDNTPSNDCPLWHKEEAE